MKHDNVMLVFGRARSGTTWLANMLSNNYNIRFIEEPFREHVSKNDRYIRVFDNNTKDLIAGFTNGYHDKYYVIKEVRLNHNVEWFYNRYDGIKACAIIRHPFGSIFSCMKFTREFFSNPFLKMYSLPNGLNSYEPAYIDIRATYTWLWCAENMMILDSADKTGMPIIQYENLVKNTTEELGKVDWCLTPEKMASYTKGGPTTVQSWSKPKDIWYWKDLLTKEDIIVIEKTIDAFCDKHNPSERFMNVLVGYGIFEGGLR